MAASLHLQEGPAEKCQACRYLHRHMREHSYCVPGTWKPLSRNTLNPGEMSGHLRCVLFLVNAEELKSKTLEWLKLMRHWP